MFAIEVLTGIKIATLLLVALSAFGASVFLVRRAKGVTTQAFWLQIISVCGWSLSLFFALAFHSIFAAQIAFVFPPIFAGGLLLIALAYPHEKWKRQYLLALLPLLVASIAGAVPDFYVTDIAFHNGYLDGSRSRWNLVYSLIILIYMVVPAVLLARKAKAEKRPQLAQRFRLLAIVSGVSYGVSFVTNALLPIAFHFPYLNATGPVWAIPVTLVAFWLLAQRYAVDRRVLYGYILGRIAIFVTSIVVYVVMLVTLLLTSVDILAASIAATVTTIFTLTAFGRSMLYVVEAFASGGAHDGTPGLSEALSRAITVPMVEQAALAFLTKEEHAPSADVILTTTADELISERVAEFISSSQPSAGSFYLREHAEGEEWGVALLELAESIGAGLIVPLVHDRHVIGILSLGDKRDGYTAEDCVRYARYGRIITAQLIRVALATHAERQISNLEARIARS